MTDWGQREPLWIRISNILKDQYPEGSIIFEVLQNADDAGASCVDFYLDSQTYPQENLCYPQFADFQGSSLTIFNDALFTKTDWENLRNLGNSRKKENLTTTGEFGLGFNAYYHLTDVPSILSGNTFVMFDPCEIMIETAGKKWNGDELSQVKNELTAFSIVGFDGKNLKGTAFRLPLRTPNQAKKSKLKNESISIEKIEEKYFEQLKEEASRILLFLKHLRTINVYRINQNGEKTTLFSLRLDCDEEVLKKRKKFLPRLEAKSFEKIERVIYELKVTYETSEMIQNTYDWLICGQLGGEEISKFAVQHSDSLKLVPWASVAIPLNFTEQGKAFCFLPLPISTGLPIHVHGFFKLSADRQNIRIEERGDIEKVKSKWNFQICQNLIASLYVYGLKHLTKKIATIEPYFNPYSSKWPKIVEVEPWKTLVTKFYDLVQSENPDIFRTANSDWKPLSNVRFLDSDEDLLQSFLYENKAQIVVHQEWAKNIKNILKNRATSVDPSFVRSILKSPNFNIPIEIEETHFSLLEYCLRDGSFSEIVDIPLLPLANGKFTTFKNPKHNPIFILEKNELNLFKQKLSQFLSPDIPPSLLNRLKDFAKQQPPFTNLKHLPLDQVLRKLHPELSIEGKNELPKSWICDLWKVLRGKSLKNFQGLYIVPTKAGQLVSLSNNKIISGETEISDILLKLGFDTVNSDVSHKEFGVAYFYASDVLGILKAMTTNKPDFSTLKATEIQQIYQYFSNHHFKISNELLPNLKSLPIFENVKGKFISLERNCIIEPPELHPDFFSLSLPVPVLRNQQDQLLKKLVQNQETKKNFYFQYCISSLQNMARTNFDIFKRLLKLMLEDLSQDESKEHLRNNLCLPNGVNQLLKCQDLLHPKLLNLFSSDEQERFFLHPNLRTEKSILELVRTHLKGEEIKTRVLSIPKTDKVLGVQRARELFFYLYDNFEKLKKDMMEVQNELLNCAWLPCADPEEDLKPFWAQDLKTYYSPKHIFPWSLKTYVFAWSPLLPPNFPESEEISQFFGWGQIDIQSLVRQLKALKVASDSSKEFSKLVSIVEPIYKKLQTLNVSVDNLKNESWVVTEIGLKKSSEVALRNEIDLTKLYLPVVTNSLRTKFFEFFNAMKIRKNYSFDDYLSIFNLLEIPLKEKAVEMVRDILQFVIRENAVSRLKQISCVPTQKMELKVPQPSIYFVDDKETVEEVDDQVEIVHSFIPLEISRKLDLTPLKMYLIEKNSSPLGGEFGQFESLTTRINGILEEYPCDDTIVKEMLQNADDAGAKKMYVVLDKRTHSKEENKLSSILGPSLLFYNDQAFRDEDIKAIQKLGLGGKRDDNTKTGRFGIGFNVCYHITDVPSFVTRDSAYFFDPHIGYIPGSNINSPGRYMTFTVKQNSLLQSLFNPFIWPEVGCTMKDTFHGALFRFPLRTKEQAEKSEIKSQECSIKFIEQTILDEISSDFLLFLRNIEEIRVYVWQEYSESPSCIQTLRIEGALNRSERIPTSPSVITNELVISHEKKKSSKKHHWIISNCYGSSKNLLEFATKDKKLLPVGGTAVLIPLNEKPNRNIYCFLPLQEKLGFPCVINGTFYLSSNRRNLWLNSEKIDKKTQWNNQLIQDTIIPSYFALLKYLQQKYEEKKLEYSGDFYNLFPQHGSHYYEKRFLEDFYNYPLLEFKLFRTLDGLWKKMGDGYFVTSHVTKEVQNCLCEEGVNLFQIPFFIIKVFQEKKKGECVTPALVRKIYRMESKQKMKFSSPPKPSLRNKETLFNLLSYCMMDNCRMSELYWLPFLPLANSEFFTTIPPPSLHFLEERAEFHSLLKEDCFVDKEIKRYLSIESVENLKLFSFEELIQNFSFTPFPSEWKGKLWVEWETSKCSIEWLTLLWKYTEEKLARTNFHCPLLPSNCGKLLSTECKDIFVSTNIDQNMIKLLTKIGCPTINSDICPFQAYGKDPLELLLLLKKFQFPITIHHLTNEEKLQLIQRFLDWKKISENKIFLRTLSFFETQKGEFIAIGDQNYSVLGDSVPNIPKAVKILLLKKKEELITFYHYLDIPILTKPTFYSKHVLQVFDQLEEEERYQSLLDLRSWCSENPMPEDLKSVLLNLKFIPNQGTLYACNQFFSPKVTVLAALFPEKLPPSPFDDEEWLNFLSQIGLKEKIDINEFLEAAKRAASLQSEAVSFDLIQMLWDLNPKKVENQLNQILEIPFVPTYKSQTEHSFSSFKKMGLYKDRYLLCFQRDILHESITIPRLWSNYQFISELQVEEVIEQLIYATNSPKEEEIEKIFQECYKWLNQNALSNPALLKLRDVACVMVEGHERISFVKPCMVFFKLSEQLPPYLYEVPRKLGPFEAFFKAIGVKEQPNLLSFLQVFEKMHKENPKLEIRPNNRLIIGKILQMIKEYLKTKPEERIGQCLLPDLNFTKFHLAKELYYQDDRVDFSTEEIPFVNDLVDESLAIHLGVQPLSKCIHEEIEVTQMDTLPEHREKSFLLEKILCSKDFRDALLQCSEELQKDKINQVLDEISTYSVKFVNQITVHTFLNGNKVHTSNRECVIDKTSRIIYSLPGKEVEIAERINLLLGKPIDGIILSKILQLSSPQHIFDYLKNEGYHFSMKESFEPGAQVSTQWETRIIQNPTEVFSIDELIVWKNNNIYCYGKILGFIDEKVRVLISPQGEEKIISRVLLYKFDKNNDVEDNTFTSTTEIEVSSNENETTEVSSNENETTEEKSYNLDQILDKIKNEIEREKNSVTKEELKQIFKRYFLVWHPDKNINKDIANEVFKFIRTMYEEIFSSTPTEVEEECEFEIRQRYYYSPPPSVPVPNQNEYQRWIKQAESELEVAKELFALKRWAQTCFFCHQVAEKTLKAGVYGIDSRKVNLTNHSLNEPYSILVNSLGNPNIEVYQLENYYIRTRYPNAVSTLIFPSALFTELDAKKAIELAENLFQWVKNYAPSSH